MKKQQIVFSGIAAAILLSAGAANAANVATQIASRQYVDNKTGDVTTTVMGTTADTLAGAIGELSGKISDNAGAIDDLTKTDGTIAGIQQDIADLQGKEDKDTTYTAGAGIDITGNVIKSTAVIDSELSTTSTNAVQNAVVTSALNAKADAGLVEEALDLKADLTAIADMQTTGNIQSAVTTENSASTTLYPSMSAMTGYTYSKTETDNKIGDAVEGIIAGEVGDVLDSKVDTDQKTENAGKAMVVGADGMVVPGMVSDAAISGVSVNKVSGLADKISDAISNAEITQAQVAGLSTVVNQVGQNTNAIEDLTKTGGTIAGIQQDIADLQGKEDKDTTYTAGAGIDITDNVIKTTAVIDSELSTTSTNAVQNAVVTSALNGKADTSALNNKLDTAQGTENAGRAMIVGADGNVTVADATLGTLATAAPGSCSNETSLCVLSFDGTNYRWVNVTDPVNE